MPLLSHNSPFCLLHLLPEHRAHVYINTQEIWSYYNFLLIFTRIEAATSCAFWDFFLVVIDFLTFSFNCFAILLNHILMYQLSYFLDIDPNLFFLPSARRGLRGHPFKVLQGPSHRRRRGSPFSVRVCEILE